MANKNSTTFESLDSSTTKIGIVGVLSNPAKKLTSHNAGWTYVLKSFIERLGRDAYVLTEKDNWNNMDELLINEGVNYKEGVYNLFGGVSDKNMIRLKKLNEFKGKVWNLGDTIDYQDFCEKRKIDFNFTKEIFDLDFKHMSRKLVYGDSHSISVYKPGFAISRNDGSTLYGMLKKGLSNLIPKGLDELIFYAGNIDIRHHLCRYWKEEPAIDYLHEILFLLEYQLSKLDSKKISLVELLPIENESRKIPTTGMYKGTPFYGAWWERNELAEAFNIGLKEICERNNYEFLTWPDEFVNDSGELKFEVMEGKSSVHLAPHSYMFADEFIYKKQLNLF